MIEFVHNSTVQLVKHNASDVDVAHAAWVSNFGSNAKTRDTSNISKLINFLYNNKHMSPFEHGSFTFFIDTPIFVAREFMRHRTFSYNETSGRYKEMEPRFYIPAPSRPLVQVGTPGKYSFEAGDSEDYALMHQASIDGYTTSWKNYKMQLDSGIAREVARNVLPLGLMTQFYATANPRNVMQFLELRNAPQALDEIQAVARDIEEQFSKAMPLTWEAFSKDRANRMGVV